MSSGPDGPNPWSRATRDRWFFGALAAATAALGVLVWPYADVLLFAVTTVAVTWPVHRRVLRGTRGRPVLASVLTTIGLALVVFGPLVLLLYLFAVEAVAVVQQGIVFVTSGRLEEWVLTVLYTYPFPQVQEWLGDLLPPDFDPLEAILAPLQRGLLTLLNSVGTVVPLILNTVVSGSIDTVIFLLAVVSLYVEGPRVLVVLKRLSPMDDTYEDRLFEVFRQFANNLVIGSLATAALQGTVAGIGYAIAGVDRVLFAAILTGVFSFVPLVGTTVVWIPLSVYVAVQHGVEWGVFLAVWSITFTGTVDNLVKPLFLRGASQIHPLLIFLAVFGGLAWMGLSGILVGPVVVAFFLALYTMYCEDFLGIPAQVPEQPRESWWSRVWSRWVHTRSGDPQDGDADP